MGLLTTEALRKILKERVPPQGNDDPITIFTSCLLAMSERQDAIESMIVGQRKRIKDLTTIVGEIAKALVGDGEPGAEAEPVGPGPVEAADSEEETEEDLRNIKPDVVGVVTSIKPNVAPETTGNGTP